MPCQELTPPLAAIVLAVAPPAVEEDTIHAVRVATLLISWYPWDPADGLDPVDLRIRGSDLGDPEIRDFLGLKQCFRR